MAALLIEPRSGTFVVVEGAGRGDIMTFPSLIGDIEDAEKRAKEATAIRMLKAGKLAMEEIANYSALSLAAVQKLAKAVSLGTV